MRTKESAPVEQKPVLGRCKGCDYALWSKPEDIRQANSLNDVHPGAAYRMTDKGNLLARCPNRHKVFRLHQVEGEFDSDVKCDGRCEGARGHVCRCACGGMNHGRGHAGNVQNVSEAVEVVSEPSERREPTDAQIAFVTTLQDERGIATDETALRGMDRAEVSRYIDSLKAMPRAQQEAQGEVTKFEQNACLGECGESITGTALVTHEQQVQDATLYLFRAFVDDKFGIMKWFKPSYVNVNFAKGDQVTFTARVKRYEKPYGNTVVTHLEATAEITE